MKGHRHIVLVVTVLVVSANSAEAQNTSRRLGTREDAPWFLSVTPYYWASNFGGARVLEGARDSIQVGGYAVSVGPERLNDNLAFHIEVGRRRWSLASLSTFGAQSDAFSVGPLEERGTYDLHWREIPLNVNYRVGPLLSPYLQLYAGLRWVTLSQSLTGSEGQSLGKWVAHWVDPGIGGRVAIYFGGGLLGAAQVDVAGFHIGSDLSWSVGGDLIYHLFGPVSLSGSYVYKQISYDNRKGRDKQITWKDAVAQGWLLGIRFSIPKGQP